MTDAQITALTAGVAAILTAVFVQGGNLAIRWLREHASAGAADDARADRAYATYIKKLEARVKASEEEIIALRKAYDQEMRDRQREHEECIRTTTAQSGEIALLKQQISDLERVVTGQRQDGSTR